jgi:diguanylate cyclase (GGDEF)-like protein
MFHRQPERLGPRRKAERLLSFANRLDATHQIAYLDPVTQLPNSIAAERELKRAILESQRAMQEFSILFIDGDNLRFYNDISYSAGDNMLKRLSELLSNHLRPGDFIARWRVGDEFLVLLPGANRNDAFTVAERIRSEVESRSKGWEIPITISIGVAQYRPGESLEALEERADQALYIAKQQGRNQVMRWSAIAPAVP